MYSGYDGTRWITSFDGKVGIATGADASYALKVNGHTYIANNTTIGGTTNILGNTAIGYSGSATEMLVVGKDLGNLTSFTGMVFGSNDYAHFFIGESSTSYGAMSYRANLDGFYTWNN